MYCELFDDYAEEKKCMMIFDLQITYYSKTSLVLRTSANRMYGRFEWMEPTLDSSLN